MGSSDGPLSAGWRFLVIIYRLAVTALALWFLSEELSAYGSASFIGALMGIGVLWWKFVRPKGRPLVWYVTFLGALAGSTLFSMLAGGAIGWVAGYGLDRIPYGLSYGVSNGIVLGIVLALWIFAIRGPVSDPADLEDVAKKR